MRATILISLFLILIGVSAQARTLHVVSYNVENLFDWQHDEGHGDFEYLPVADPIKEIGCRAGNPNYLQVCLESDWTQAVVEKKIDQLARTLETTTAGRPSIDLLGVQEIENAQVAGLLAKRLGSDVKFLITTGQDSRGINVALLYRESDDLKLLRWREINVPGKHLDGKLSRNILEAVFSLKGRKLGVYVNHWPSQNNSALARVDAARALKRAVLLGRLRGVKDVLALGDFNVVDSDYPHPFKSELTDGLFGLVDVLTQLSPARQAQLPMGSYFFAKRMQWNFLDHFFVSPSMLEKDAPLQATVDSFTTLVDEINSAPYQYTKGEYAGTVIAKTPRHFDEKSGEGAADHFPISLLLETK